MRLVCIANLVAILMYLRNKNTIMNHSIKKLGKEKGIKYVGN